jgi:hypothetical protein
MRKFWLLLGMSVGLFLIYQGIRERHRNEAKSDWPATEGRVEDAALYQNGNSIYVDVKYKYSVSQSEFTGRSIVDSADDDSIPDAYRPGSSIVVHFDPDSPERSYLVHDSDSGSWGLIILGGIALFICLPFIAIQVLLWFADFVLWKARRHMRQGLAALNEGQAEIDKLLTEGKPVSDEVMQRQDEVLEQANRAYEMLKDVERQRRTFG